MRGPTTLEIVTLNGGFRRSATRVREMSRTARAATAGGKNSARLDAISMAGTASWVSLAARMARWMAANRSAGRSRWVARGARMADTRFE